MEVTDNINESNPTEDSYNIAGTDPPVSKKMRLKLFLQIYWRGIFCALVPILLISMLAPFPPEKYKWCAYTLVLTALFWMTECIPLAITSFLPIVLFPLTGVMDTNTACKCYMNDTIFMFLGSIALAYAVEQSGLHKRLAFLVIRTIGYSHYRLLFAMSFTTMFTSMWITNTAATTLMVPINFALLKVFEDQNLLQIYVKDNSGEMIASDFTTCYFCANTFSATIGGIGTLVGTATNLAFKGLFERAYPEAEEYFSFPKFSAFTIPIMLILETCLYFNMLIIYFGFLRPNSETAKRSKISDEGVMAAKNAVDENWKKLGTITFWEIMVIILFVGAMLMFFSRSPQVFYGWGDMISDYFGLDTKKFVQDSSTAMLIVFLMLYLPSTLDFFQNFKAEENELPDKTIPAVLDWVTMNENMPYEFMFLLGAGFALSEAAKEEYSDLNGQIGIVLRNMSTLPNYMIIFLIVVSTVFITNFASNVAVANVLVPIVMQLAKEINVHPLWYNITAGISASFCYSLPVGTPDNLVVQGIAKIRTIDMVKAGIGPTIATIIVIWMGMCFWAPVIWNDLHYIYSMRNNTY